MVNLNDGGLVYVELVLKLLGPALDFVVHALQNHVVALRQFLDGGPHLGLNVEVCLMYGFLCSVYSFLSSYLPFQDCF